MRTPAIAALLVLATSAAPAAAGEPVAGPTGFLCDFSRIRENRAVIEGGPLVLVDADGTVRTATLTCTVLAAGVAHAASATGTGAVALVPAVLPWSEPLDGTWLCTEVGYAGGPTLYWHSSNDPTVNGHWTTDPDAPCAEQGYAAPGDPAEPVEYVLLQHCALLAVLLPPDGDVPELADCPPPGA